MRKYFEEPTVECIRINTEVVATQGTVSDQFGDDEY